MKIRITGRLGEPVQRGATIVTSIRCQTAKAPLRLPDELPALPDMTVTYTILIAPRHWRSRRPSNRVRARWHLSLRR